MPSEADSAGKHSSQNNQFRKMEFFTFCGFSRVSNPSVRSDLRSLAVILLQMLDACKTTHTHNEQLFPSIPAGIIQAGQIKPRKGKKE